MKNYFLVDTEDDNVLSSCQASSKEDAEILFDEEGWIITEEGLEVISEEEFKSKNLSCDFLDV